MGITPEHNERIVKITFASVYPHFITKVKKRQDKRRIASSDKMADQI